MASCSAYSEHKFKKNICRNCFENKADHNIIEDSTHDTELAQPPISRSTLNANSSYNGSKARISQFFSDTAPLQKRGNSSDQETNDQTEMNEGHLFEDMSDDLLFEEFRKILRELLHKYEVELVERQFDEIAGPLFNHELETLNDEDNGIGKIISDDTTNDTFTTITNAIRSNEKFNDIWRIRKLTKTTPTGSLYTNFKSEIVRLYKSASLPDKVDLELLAQSLYKNKHYDIKNFVKNSLLGRQTKELITMIQSSEELNNIWSDLDDQDKFEGLKRFKETLLGKDGQYSDNLFSEILRLDFDKLENIIQNLVSCGGEKCLLDVMLPFILIKLKQGVKLEAICGLRIFWKEESVLYGMDSKTLFVCMLERYIHHQKFIVSLFTKLGMALPFAYQWVIEDKLISKIPLRSYSHYLRIDSPIIVSLGSDSIGKSTLLQAIYHVNFITCRDGKINNGIDVVFSTIECPCGFTIFDVHDNARRKKHLLQFFFKMIPRENYWILLHSQCVEETNAIINMLKLFQIEESQIICIVRDIGAKNYEQIKSSINNRVKEVLSISKINMGSEQFRSDLSILKETLFNLTGIGQRARKPNGHQSQPGDVDIYMKMEECVFNEPQDRICIDIECKDARKFYDVIDRELNNLKSSNTNSQTGLFPHINLKTMIKCKEREKTKVTGKDITEIQNKAAKIDLEINDLLRKKTKTELNALIGHYNVLFLRKDFDRIDELINRVEAWQKPDLDPLFSTRSTILEKLCKTDEEIKNIREALKNPKNELASEKKQLELKLEKLSATQKVLEKDKNANSKRIDTTMISRYIFMRELLAIYGDQNFLNRHKHDTLFNKQLYIDAFVQYMIKGHEVEIIDGDNNGFNPEIISSIFEGLQNKLAQEHDEPPFVISVIGPQSTGKSTLLNMLFGSHFQMGAGRCTKGLYASVFKTEYPKAKTLLVLDTEGLLSIEKADEEYDKKLTLISMACSQFLIINLKGEINESMKKILSISLFVANQLKMFKTRPMIMFVLRDMTDLDMGKQATMMACLKKELENISQLSRISLADVLDFSERDGIVLMPCAYIQEVAKNLNDTMFTITKTSVDFTDRINVLRKKIFDIADNAKSSRFKSLLDWVNEAKNVWMTIDLYGDMMMLDSIKEIHEREELGGIISKIMKDHLEPNREIHNLSFKINNILDDYEKQSDISENPQLVINDIESAAENYKDIVREEFEQAIESKTFEDKLKNEFRDRLVSATDSIKRQGIERRTALVEKHKVEKVIADTMKDLSHQSSETIIRWQEKRKQMTNEQNEKEKQSVIEGFQKQVSAKESETINTLEKKLKTSETWFCNVAELICTAARTMPVEKQFFSIRKLNENRPTNVSDDDIFKTLIAGRNCIQHASSGDLNIAPIRKFIQDKDPAEDLIRRTTSSAQKTHTEPTKQDSNTGTFGYLRNLFGPFIKHLSKSKETGNDTAQSVSQNNSSQQKLQPELDRKKIGDVLGMLFQVGKYVRDTVGNEVRNIPQYTTICVKQHLEQIYSQLESTERNLAGMNLEMKPDFKDELAKYFQSIVANKMLKDERDTYEKIKADFKEKINHLLKDFIKRLQNAFGDAENAADIAEKVLDHIWKECLSYTKREYENTLRQNTYLNPQDFVKLMEKIFENDEGKPYDKERIYKFIQEREEYMKETYSDHFESTAKKLRNIAPKILETRYKCQYKVLTQTISGDNRFFMQFEDNPSYSKLHEQYFIGSFKAYLEDDRAALEILRTNYFSKINVHWCSSPELLASTGKLFQEIMLSSYKITNPCIFLRSFRETIETCNSKYNTYTDANQLINIVEIESRIEGENYPKAKGCVNQCFYCGCKCTSMSLDEHKCSNNRHLLMAFNKCFEIQGNGRKGFIFDPCTSASNLSTFRWKDSSRTRATTVFDPSIRERMNKYSLGDGEVKMTLLWKDSNDLDLHVICPCGTRICYLNNRCSTCDGYLDVDMNVCCHPDGCTDTITVGNKVTPKCSSTNAIENIFFKQAKCGIYKVFVHYYSGPKHNAGTTSNFEVYVKTHNGEHQQTIKGRVGVATPDREYEVGKFEHTPNTLGFLEHAKKHCSNWTFTVTEDTTWVNKLRRAWCEVADQISDESGFENNTPPEFKQLTCE